METNGDLWKSYAKNRDDKTREQIIKAYLPLVKYFTDRISYQLPAEVRKNDREDLYIEGVIGLIEAVEKFDIARNIKFETFASKRVRGAIIDSLRKEDLLPKNVRETAKKVENAYIATESRLGRPATDEEMAEELGMTTEAFYDILDKIKGITLLSLDGDILSRNGEKFSFEDILGDEPAVLIEFEKDEVRAMLAGFIDALDKDERTVLECYYWHEMNFKEIGKVLDVSESRVCQIHTKTVLRLRSGFKKTA
ncbi:MAG: FliA/WhiG family RNA polymerase sigma factor [Candidatus Goldbacteria bacterium]|nr:FliA/WhiG family RNA polymerase sigma factor [Candidatus Goldiibacteriota bacterium]